MKSRKNTIILGVSNPCQSHGARLPMAAPPLLFAPLFVVAAETRRTKDAGKALRCAAAWICCNCFGAKEAP